MILKAQKAVPDSAIAIRIYDDLDNLVSSVCMPEEGFYFVDLDGETTVRVALPKLQLIPREYYVNVYVFQLHHMDGPLLEVEHSFKMEVQGDYLPGATNYYKREHGLIRIADKIEVIRTTN